MGAKRTWIQANSQASASASPPNPADSVNLYRTSASAFNGRGDINGNGYPSILNEGSRDHEPDPLQHLPAISRKVKACAACRKQKVRCLMDESGPPCRRCAEKDLGCVLNKSLQTLINERLPSNDALLQDLEMVHSSVQSILISLNLPAIGHLQSSRAPRTSRLSSSEDHPNPAQDVFDDAGPSCDNSPKISPEDDHDLPKVPIHSVYHLTKLAALRSPDATEEDIADPEHVPKRFSSTDDFIARGLIPIETAERLFRLYTDRLDHYMYGVGARYQTLAELRKKSAILTAAIMTVAAMHDPKSNNVYLVCNREFRRLTTASLFDRRIDRDHLRALCVASYWLNDTSWILSGVASRRAAEFNITRHYNRLSESNEHTEDSADFVRIWYLIYICDQHLATLFGRQCTSREDAAIQGWEMLTKAATATTGDQRLVSQVALLTIIHNIRELFGSDADKPIPEVFSAQIKGFSRQLDQWVGHWTTTMPEYQENFGSFPRKGAVLHFNFAKLCLNSHVFRGLREGAISLHFLEAAHGAISAATAILNLIISDADVRAGLIGLPCYIQSMIGFACMFLSKLTLNYGDEMIGRSLVVDLLSKLVSVYRSTPVGKWHLVHLMANGLDKILDMIQRPAGDPSASGQNGEEPPGHPLSLPGDFADMAHELDMSMINLHPQFLLDTTGMGIGMGSFYGNDAFDFGESHQGGLF